VVSEDTRAFRPSEAAEQLGIPPSTLRTYAFQFRAILSPEAGAEPPAAGRGFRHRRYTEADLVVLRHAMLLLGDGLSYRAVLARLGRVAPGATAGAPERRSQARRSRLSAVPVIEPRVPRNPTTGGARPPPASPPARYDDGNSHGQQVQPVAPGSSGLDESALDHLKALVSHLEMVVAEQTRSIDRVERAVSATFRALQELKNQLATPAGLPGPTEPRDRRGWLAHLLRINRT
jgi:DNA-binding transcriptional MerR regulator